MRRKAVRINERRGAREASKRARGVRDPRQKAAYFPALALGFAGNTPDGVKRSTSVQLKRVKLAVF